MANENPIQLIVSGKLDSRLRWHCEPASWKIDNNSLAVLSDSQTDFWQRTHYGFRADNGHLLYLELEGDFILETQVKCDFLQQYDQAGLMVWVSEDCWVKASVENELSEPRKLGAVVTNHGYSDWSTQNVDNSFNDYKLQIIRSGSDYKVSYFDEANSHWVQIRLLHLHDTPTVRAGIYACSPKEGGFTATFKHFTLY